MVIDLTINLGHVLTIIMFIAGGLGFVYMIKSDVRLLGGRILVVEATMEDLKHDIKEMDRALIEIARQDERLNAVDLRLQSQGNRIDSLIERFNKLIDKQVI